MFSGDLILATDSFGIKKIYVYHSGHFLIWASEYKSLVLVVNSLNLPLSVRKSGLEEVFSFLSPFLGKTLHDNIFTLLPGHSLKFNVHDFLLTGNLPNSVGDSFYLSSFKNEKSFSNTNFNALKSVLSNTFVSDVPF